ncbi:MAG TPA: metallophosphoesterase family protein [Verrucomicrobiae bacterium]|nr:metallophosphoesterase family protein [Verrucomicrobiae bacterium]
MRYLIISDVHANWQALNAVAQFCEGKYEQVICCGDLVGYGADPNPVTDWVRKHCQIVVRGNHDRSCTGLDGLEWFNPVARQAALWTQHALTRENADYIRSLPKGPLLVADFQVVHGAPYDEDEYLIGSSEAAEAFGYLERRVVFFGHTHVQGGFIWNHSRVETIPRMPSDAQTHILDIDPECAYMINPGSVGQPRDGDPRAASVIYDSEAKVLTYVRTEYDIPGAQRQIRESALPAILADRLAVGR